MKPLGTTTVDHMARREAGDGTRWIVFKLPNTTPERWAVGPRGTGVYASITDRRRWVLYDTNIDAHAYATDCIEIDRRHAAAALKP